MNGTLIPHTPIAVDFWKVRKCPSAKLFFLTHMHADHTVGLTPSWARPLYCSPVTARLLKHKFKIKDSLIHTLEVGESHTVFLDDTHCEQMTVTPLDAHHCPGSVMYLFQGYFGTILHTGDFRYCRSMFDAGPLSTGLRIDVLYLDNTYCNPAVELPTRQQALEEIISIMERHPQHRVLIGMRQLGKEDLLVKLAKHFKVYVSVEPWRHTLYEQLELPPIFSQDENTGRIVTVDTNKFNLKLLERFNLECPTIAVLPTALYTILHQNQLQTRNSNVYVVPYSDHSSFHELKEFVSQVRPGKVIPVVKEKRHEGKVLATSNMSHFHSCLDPYNSPLDSIEIPDSVKAFIENRNVSEKRPSSSLTRIEAAHLRKPLFSRKISSGDRSVKGVQYDSSLTGQSVCSSSTSSGSKVEPEMPLLVVEPPPCIITSSAGYEEFPPVINIVPLEEPLEETTNTTVQHSRVGTVPEEQGMLNTEGTNQQESTFPHQVATQVSSEQRSSNGQKEGSERSEHQSVSQDDDVERDDYAGESAHIHSSSGSGQGTSTDLTTERNDMVGIQDGGWVLLQNEIKTEPCGTNAVVCDFPGQAIQSHSLFCLSSVKVQPLDSLQFEAGIVSDPVLDSAADVYKVFNIYNMPTSTTTESIETHEVGHHQHGLLKIDATDDEHSVNCTSPVDVHHPDGQKEFLPRIVHVSSVCDSEENPHLDVMRGKSPRKRGRPRKRKRQIVQNSRPVVEGSTVPKRGRPKKLTPVTESSSSGEALKHVCNKREPLKVKIVWGPRPDEALTTRARTYSQYQPCERRKLTPEGSCETKYPSKLKDSMCEDSVYDLDQHEKDHPCPHDKVNSCDTHASIIKDNGIHQEKGIIHRKRGRPKGSIKVFRLSKSVYVDRLNRGPESGSVHNSDKPNECDSTTTYSAFDSSKAISGKVKGNRSYLQRGKRSRTNQEDRTSLITDNGSTSLLTDNESTSFIADNVSTSLLTDIGSTSHITDNVSTSLLTDNGSTSLITDNVSNQMNKKVDIGCIRVSVDDKCCQTDQPGDIGLSSGENGDIIEDKLILGSVSMIENTEQCEAQECEAQECEVQEDLLQVNDDRCCWTGCSEGTETNHLLGDTIKQNNGKNQENGNSNVSIEESGLGLRHFVVESQSFSQESEAAEAKGEVLEDMSLHGFVLAMTQKENDGQELSSKNVEEDEDRVEPTSKTSSEVTQQIWGDVSRLNEQTGTMDIQDNIHAYMELPDENQNVTGNKSTSAKASSVTQEKVTVKHGDCISDSDTHNNSGNDVNKPSRAIIYNSNGKPVPSTTNVRVSIIGADILFGTVTQNYSTNKDTIEEVTIEPGRFNEVNKDTIGEVTIEPGRFNDSMEEVTIEPERFNEVNKDTMEVVTSEPERFNEVNKNTMKEVTSEPERFNEIYKDAVEEVTSEPERFNEVNKDTMEVVTSEPERFNEVNKDTRGKVTSEPGRFNQFNKDTRGKVTSEPGRFNEVNKNTMKEVISEPERFNEIYKDTVEEVTSEPGRFNEVNKDTMEVVTSEPGRFNEVNKDTMEVVTSELGRFNKVNKDTMEVVTSKQERFNEINEVTSEPERFNEINKVTSEPERFKEIHKETTMEEVTIEPERFNEIYKDTVEEVTSEPERFNEVNKDTMEVVTSEPERFNEVNKDTRGKVTSEPGRFNQFNKDTRGKVTSEPGRFNEVNKDTIEEVTSEPGRFNEINKDTMEVVTSKPERFNDTMVVVTSEPGRFNDTIEEVISEPGRFNDINKGTSKPGRLNEIKNGEVTNVSSVEFSDHTDGQSDRNVQLIVENRAVTSMVGKPSISRVENFEKPSTPKIGRNNQLVNQEVAVTEEKAKDNSCIGDVTESIFTKQSASWNKSVLDSVSDIFNFSDEYDGIAACEPHSGCGQHNDYGEVLKESSDKSAAEEDRNEERGVRHSDQNMRMVGLSKVYIRAKSLDRELTKTGDVLNSSSLTGSVLSKRSVKNPSNGQLSSEKSSSNLVFSYESVRCSDNGINVKNVQRPLFDCTEHQQPNKKEEIAERNVIKKKNKMEHRTDIHRFGSNKSKQISPRVKTNPPLQQLKELQVVLGRSVATSKMTRCNAVPLKVSKSSRVLSHAGDKYKKKIGPKFYSEHAAKSPPVQDLNKGLNSVEYEAKNFDMEVEVSPRLISKDRKVTSEVKTRCTEEQAEERTLLSSEKAGPCLSLSTLKSPVTSDDQTDKMDISLKHKDSLGVSASSLTEEFTPALSLMEPGKVHRDTIDISRKPMKRSFKQSKLGMQKKQGRSSLDVADVSSRSRKADSFYVKTLKGSCRTPKTVQSCSASNSLGPICAKDRSIHDWVNSTIDCLKPSNLGSNSSTSYSAASVHSPALSAGEEAELWPSSTIELLINQEVMLYRNSHDGVTNKVSCNLCPLSKRHVIREVTSPGIELLVLEESLKYKSYKEKTCNISCSPSALSVLPNQKRKSLLQGFKPVFNVKHATP